MVVWGMIAPVFVGLVYAILLPLLRRTMRMQSIEPNSSV